MDLFVSPAKAGAHALRNPLFRRDGWIPAYAGTTKILIYYAFPKFSATHSRKPRRRRTQQRPRVPIVKTEQRLEHKTQARLARGVR